MKLLCFFTFLLLVSSTFTCSSKKPSSDLELIGGKYADPDEMGFVVRINQACTASRVGFYEYLTAAHCLIDATNGKIKFQYTFGEQLVIENAKSLAENRKHETSVFYIDIHPSYDYKIKLSEERILSNSNMDLAFVVVKDLVPLEEVPLVNFSPSRLSNGDSVTMVGYGCEEISEKTGGGKLKYGSQKIANRSNTHYFTKNKIGTNVVQLCPGDSGGPLLVRASGSYMLQGVNQGMEYSDNKNLNHLLYSSFTRIDSVPWISDPTRPNPQKIKARSFTCLRSELQVMHKGLPANTALSFHSFSAQGLNIKDRFYFTEKGKFKFSITNVPDFQDRTLEFPQIFGDYSPYLEFQGQSLRGLVRLARGVQDKDYHLEFLMFDLSDSSKLDSIHLYLPNCQ